MRPLKLDRPCIITVDNLVHYICVRMYTGTQRDTHASIEMYVYTHMYTTHTHTHTHSHTHACDTYVHTCV